MKNWHSVQGHRERLICQGDDIIAVVPIIPEGSTVAVANSWLLAAAPDLCEAAKMAREYMKANCVIGGDILDALNNSIAKAEGK
jgi:hypothetical protein